MADRPDGKPVGIDKVAFTRPAADRIAKAVRIVEAGDRDARALYFGNRLQNAPFRLRVGTFTGDWQTGEYKVVTLSGSTNTASVYNWCNPALGGNTNNTTEKRFVIFGKAEGRQSAVEIQLDPSAGSNSTCSLTIAGIDLTKFPGYSAGEIQVLGHNNGDASSGCGAAFKWYSITTCATATA